MDSFHDTPENTLRLRREAEQRARDRLDDLHKLDQTDRHQLLQELQIHQIELELQNEELRSAQQQLEITRQQYIDLYNEAPIGYASLDDTGLVLRANQTLARLLDTKLDYLRGRALVEFMDPEDQEMFRGRFNAFVRNPAGKHIDVRFRRGIPEDPRPGFVGRIGGRRIANDQLNFGRRAPRQETLLVVVSDVTELKKTESQIRHQAFHDSLTGLPNRSNLYDRLETALALARRHGRYGALLFMDMDRFKSVNDSLGHAAGDELLVKFANRLRGRIRREDLLVRMGGDEFVVLLAEQEADAAQVAINAQRFAENLTEALDEAFKVAGHSIQMTVSIGMAVYPLLPDDGVADIIRQADTAMYQAKGGGKNLVRFYHGAMQKQANKRLALESELRVALVERQFEMHYQPQTKPDGSIRAVEALLRWRHPQRGLLLPKDYMQVAEETGLIVPLGEWTLESVAVQIADWCAAGLWRPHNGVAVNVSLRQFQDTEFGDRVEGILRHYDIPTTSLVFEIDESLLLPEDHVCRVELERLSRLGLAFAVHDFGTGYSSLEVLQKAPVSQLKIARRFVQELDRGKGADDPDRRDFALVRTIVSMAREMGMTVVAEGVETKRQLEVLKDLGCDLMQGFLFSPAVPPGEITRLLERGRRS